MIGPCPVPGCGEQVITVTIGGQPVRLTRTPNRRGVIAARQDEDGGGWAGRYLPPGQDLAEGEARYSPHNPRCGATAPARDAQAAAAARQRTTRAAPVTPGGVRPGDRD